MRIAISGTHCSGKTTLIDEFLLAHPEFTHEPEAYEALQEEYGETFAAEPNAEDFHRQLEYNVARLRRYGIGDRVIFERSPSDYLAYMFALERLGRERDAASVIKNSLELAQEAVALLDLIVFLPADDFQFDVPDSEEPELRSVVDAILEGILIDDNLGLFASNHPQVVRAAGTTAMRIQTLERAIGSVSENVVEPN
jgi:hypothetical protein